jgi:hypothetical protein
VPTTCGTNSAVLSISITGYTHTCVADMDFSFKRGAISFSCVHHLGGGADAVNFDYTFSDSGAVYPTATSAASGTYKCPSGARISSLNDQTGDITVTFSDLIGGIAGSYSGLTVTYESSFHPPGCRNTAVDVYVSGRMNSIAPLSACSPCSSRIPPSATYNVTVLTPTLLQTSCNSGYYGAVSTQMCTLMAIFRDLPSLASHARPSFFLQYTLSGSLL